ncbi:MAG: ABC transporter ATP-binding protein [Spirochaetes bacterium]|nr:ABC transporter ATP-binding protein [Spirochaetota bacterium]
MNEDILRVKGLVKHFFTRLGTVRAVDNVSFAIRRGETFGLVGESGSGKTTVAHTLVGIYKPTGGEAYFRDQSLGEDFSHRSKALKKNIRIVFQDPGSSLNPRWSIKQILELPLRIHRTSYGKNHVEAVSELLRMVELPPEEYLYKYPQAIGGGEKQMVAIARALATEPDFVALDEPTSALDVSIQAKIIKLLTRLQKKLDLTYLFITHDLSLMRNMANRVAIMYLGKIAEVAPTREFFQKPLHPYTNMLLSSIPVTSDEEEKLKPKQIRSTGEIPSPVNIPPGCSFHLRCPRCMDICSRLDPVMTEKEAGHWVRCHLYPAAGQ